MLPPGAAPFVHTWIISGCVTVGATHDPSVPLVLWINDCPDVPENQHSLSSCRISVCPPQKWLLHYDSSADDVDKAVRWWQHNSASHFWVLSTIVNALEETSRFVNQQKCCKLLSRKQRSSRGQLYWNVCYINLLFKRIKPFVINTYGPDDIRIFFWLGGFI